MKKIIHILETRRENEQTFSVDSLPGEKSLKILETKREIEQKYVYIISKYIFSVDSLPGEPRALSLASLATSLAAHCCSPGRDASELDSLYAEIVF